MDRITIETQYRTPLLWEPTTQYAYRLFHEGTLALADVEYNGIRIDTDESKRTHKRIRREIAALEKKMDDHKAVRIWKDLFKKRFKYGSDHQLEEVLFGERGLGLEPLRFTDKGRASTDAETLKKVECDQNFVTDLIHLRKLKKLKKPYLNNIIQETVDGRLHPFFHLNIARTFRSSSSNINFQNIPIRDPETGPIIRRLFLPSPGNHLVELDYSGIEVIASCWYHKDPNMMMYVSDPTTDMHRDMAIQLYRMKSFDKKSKAEKEIRKCSKNSYVFPQFYGDYYVACATNLWDDISTYDLRLADGTPLKQHLASQGIRNYKQFEKHVQEVEKDFWGRRFKVYNGWKDEVWKLYLKTGNVHMLTGFVCSGMMTKNEVTNYPIQGAAFHTLLWSLIRINKILKTEGWKTKLIGQIHDSIVADVPPEELHDFLAMCNRVMTVDIKKEWKFIITPLEVEADYTEIDEPWSEKKPISLPSAT